MALADAFGVPSFYLLGPGKGPTPLDEELLEALRDEAAAVLREVARLPERGRGIVLGVARQLAEGCAPPRRSGLAGRGVRKPTRFSPSFAF